MTRRVNRKRRNNTVVLKNANPAQLEQAAAHNHSELFCMNATAMGGELKIMNGLTWTYTGTDRGSMIPFPSLKEINADIALDEMMAYYRAHVPKSAGCWSLHPSQPADLGIKLLARGFQPGWQPNWMALDLESINTLHASPGGLQVSADNSTSTNEIKNLPYACENGAVSNALMQAYPEHAQRFIATLNGEIVGHSCVFFTTGELGAAGIYNVGVIPEARLQGIGKAVVIAACLYAKERGYRYAVLNGTGKRMYQQIGFRWISDGLTWWLMKKDYLTDPPTKVQVSFAEAIGKANFTVLDELSSQFADIDLNKPISNGMTLMQLAIHCKQSRAAEWLLQHGAEFTVLDAWNIGWKERASTLLISDRGEVNRLYGEGQITLLHTAAERNDVALANLVLSAKPDLEIRDKIYNATAPDWTEHLHRKEIAALIKKYAET